MSKTLKLVLFLVLSLSAYAFAADENLTITTYYPSPYGNYRELRAMRVAIGDNYIDGAQYCWEGTCTTLIDDDNDSFTPSNVDLIVEGNVLIGSPIPDPIVKAKLEVQNGPIKATGGFIMQTTTGADPANPQMGQMWLRTDINP